MMMAVKRDLRACFRSGVRNSAEKNIRTERGRRGSLFVYNRAATRCQRRLETGKRKHALLSRDAFQAAARRARIGSMMMAVSPIENPAHRWTPCKLFASGLPRRQWVTLKLV